MADAAGRDALGDHQPRAGGGHVGTAQRVAVHRRVVEGGTSRPEIWSTASTRPRASAVGTCSTVESGVAAASRAARMSSKGRMGCFMSGLDGGG
jgi:hypothetical protein